MGGMPILDGELMRYIPPDDLIFEWEHVRAGLLEVKKHSAEDWLPEDVYMSIKLGQASLHMAEDKEGGYLGFMVLQLLPTYHGKKLHVWCAYGNNNQPVLRLFLNEMKTLAKNAGAKEITFTSPRDEWLAVGKRGGFEPGHTTFKVSI